MSAVRRLGVVLLSGGLDSTTVAAQARREGYELSAVTVHYGQAHRRELDSAARVAQALGIRQRVVDVSFFKELAWYSALTQPERFSLPTERKPEEMEADIPITYVPLRNTFLITMAASLLESEVLHALEREGVAPGDLQASVFIAANALDYSGYPDCRPEYYDAVLEVLRRGSKSGTQYGVALQVKTPIIRLSKAEIVRLAVEVGAPLEHTWSCYAGGERPCGRCDSCVLREKGFREAGVVDPALAPAIASGQPSR